LPLDIAKGGLPKFACAVKVCAPEESPTAG